MWNKPTVQRPISVSNLSFPNCCRWPREEAGDYPTPWPLGLTLGKREHNVGIKRHEIKMPFGALAHLKGKQPFEAEAERGGALSN